MAEPAIAPESAAPGVAGRVIEGARVCVEEAGMAGMLALRADLADCALAPMLAEAVGTELPGPLGACFADDCTAVWMAPDELLLVVPYGAQERLAATLRERLAGRRARVLDASHMRVRFRLTGPGVAELLAKGVPVDLREQAFPPGTARRTHLGPVAVLILRETPEIWTLFCFRSLAAYVADWLAAGARPGFEVGHL